MNVRFWGTRGSIPSPGPETVKYGGNTACVEVRLDSGELLILDAGTGIRKLGLQATGQGEPLKAIILLSHSHWDHIQGFPFFRPAFGTQNSFTIVGPEVAYRKLERILSDQMERVYFPLDFQAMKAEMELREVATDGELTWGDARIRTIQANHTIMCLGYRIEADHKKVVYLTDNELAHCGRPDATSHEAFVAFCQGADLLIHDAQYTHTEYATRQGWGHSTYQEAITLALEAGVGQLAFFHHDPETSDQVLTHRVTACQRHLEERQLQLDVRAAREGDVIDL